MKTDYSGLRQVVGPVFIAVLVTMQLAAFSAPAGAHQPPRAPAPAPAVNHGSHGAPGVTPLATDCSQSKLAAHDGFQEGPACVSTAFGELAAQQKGPQVLIVDAPRKVRVGEPITLKVSSRNLVRDRFLPAAQGGYYAESSLLNGDGLTRGHIHSSCRVLSSGDTAPTPDRAGDGLFVVVEDDKGNATPDTVTITLPGGLPREGDAQCAVWAGEGSHRVPMMQFANQIPAFDVVRVQVRGEKRDGDRDRRRDRREQDGG